MSLMIRKLPFSHSLVFVNALYQLAYRKCLQCPTPHIARLVISIKLGLFSLHRLFKYQIGRLEGMPNVIMNGTLLQGWTKRLFQGCVKFSETVAFCSPSAGRNKQFFSTLIHTIRNYPTYCRGDCSAIPS